jgi:tetratricopeptide (TPR) repeat protein
VKLWARCFNTPGRHQQEIIYRLVAAGMPAKEFLAKFHPDWRTLGEIWGQYKKTSQSAELEEVLSYAEAETRRETVEPGGTPPVYVWYWQSQLYSDAGRKQESLDCLQRAYACDPRQYAVRRALARALQANQNYSEAEPHVRWCLARTPSDKSLRAALEAIAKARVEQRKTAPPIDSRWKPSVSLVKPGGQTTTMRY